MEHAGNSCNSDAPEEIAVGDLLVEIPIGVEILVDDLSDEGAIMVSLEPRTRRATIFLCEDLRAFRLRRSFGGECSGDSGVWVYKFVCGIRME